MPPCPRFLSLEDTHGLRVMYLGQELACSVLEGAQRAQWASFMKHEQNKLCKSFVKPF